MDKTIEVGPRGKKLTFAAQGDGFVYLRVHNGEDILLNVFDSRRLTRFLDDWVFHGKTCASKECLNHFIAKPGKKGGPTPKFCCRECMLVAHNRGASERVKTARTKKKLEAARKLLAEHGEVVL